MWPFKKRKRFVIMRISDSTYYSGETSLGRKFGTVGWAFEPEHALHLDRDSADRVHKAMIIATIGGNQLYGPMVVIEV